MRTIVSLLLLFGLASCATVDFQPYEGRDNLYQGDGGTKVVVDGVDFWANGAPPRKYTIIGVVVSEVGSGIGDEAIIRSAAANEVKKRGGNAAIQVNNNSSFAGVVRTAPGFYMAAGVKRMQFAIVRYVGPVPATELESGGATARGIAGYWTVTFGGANAGVCPSLLIEPTGRISGSCQILQPASVAGASFTVSGVVNSAGAASLTATTGAQMSGSFSATSGGSGSWANGTASGTWLASRM